MKKIKIRCRTVDNLNKRIYTIYNCSNKEIKKTNVFGEINLYLEEGKTYKFVIDTIGYNIKTIVLLVTKKTKCLTFYFNRTKYHYITINLNDQNYDNLKIERGIINLWEDHIQ